MRVICIQKANRLNGKPADNRIPQPEEGNVYNVAAQYDFEEKAFYVLCEFPSNNIFEASMFIPLSDLDETELVNESEFLKEQQW